MTAASISRSLLIYLPGRIPTYRSRWSVLEKRLPEQRMTLPGDGTRPPIAPKFLPCPWWWAAHFLHPFDSFPPGNWTPSPPN